MSTVLVADDDPDILELVAEKLRRVGHDVSTAVDGPSALAEARRLVPDAIVLDVTMPGMTGLDVCRLLRSDLTTAAIPVIMLTARTQEDDIEGGFTVGADDYLTKPFSLDELANRLGELLAVEPRAGAVDAPRGSVEHEGPGRVALDHITSRAGILVLRALRQGGKEADELRLACAGHQLDLEPTLRAFRRDGWIREQPDEDGQRCYELTEAGEQIAWRLGDMLDWIEKSLPATILAQHRYHRAR